MSALAESPVSPKSNKQEPYARVVSRLEYQLWLRPRIDTLSYLVRETMRVIGAISDHAPIVLQRALPERTGLVKEMLLELDSQGTLWLNRSTQLTVAEAAELDWLDLAVAEESLAQVVLGVLDKFARSPL